MTETHLNNLYLNTRSESRTTVVCKLRNSLDVVVTRSVSRPRDLP